MYDLVDPALCTYVEVQSSYSKCAYAFVDPRLLASLWRQPGYVRQIHNATSCSSIYIYIYIIRYAST